MGRAGKPLPVFLYADLLNPRQLADILNRGGEGPGIEAANCYPARLLDGKCISLTKASNKWCAMATLRERGEDCCKCRGSVTGIMCMATEDSMEALKQREEGVATGHYEIIKVKIEMLVPGMEGRAIEASTFKALPQHTMTCREAEEKCSKRDETKQYIDIVAEGVCYWAQQHKDFPCNYIKGLCCGELEKQLADEIRRRCGSMCSGDTCT